MQKQYFMFNALLLICWKTHKKTLLSIS